MGRMRTILIPAVLLVLLLSPVIAQGPASVAPGPPVQRRQEISPSSEAALENLWFERKNDLESDDVAGAASRVEEMGRLMRAERLDRVTWLARGFAFEGYVHLREGNYERAREAFDLARRFDPRLAEAQTGYAWAALRAGRGITTFLAEYRRALLLRWEAFRREGRANLFLLSLISLWVLALVVLGVLLLRYQPVLRHDVGERLPASWPEGASRVAGWFVLLAPLLFWIGGAWIILYWCVLLARYMSVPERILAAGICVAVIATGPLMVLGVEAAEISSDPRILAIEEALQGGYGGGVLRELEGIADSAPDAVSIRLLLAGAYERAGRNEKAFEEYQEILRRNPDEARTLNNLGNLYMRTGQTTQAIVYYTRATAADPTQAILFYNLSLAQGDALRLADAEVSIQKVQELDRDLARALVAARSRGEEARPIPAIASREEVWREVPPMESARRTDLAGLVRMPTTIGAIAGLLLLIWISLGSSHLRAQRCVRCGEPFCGRCKRELGAKECCAQCIHVFVKKDPIAPQVRAHKLRQVERHARESRWAIRAATLLIPGTGHVLAGRTLTGVLLAAAWVVPLCVLVFGGRLVMLPSMPVLDLPSVSTVLAACFMAALWSVANLLVPKPPSV